MDSFLAVLLVGIIAIFQSAAECPADRFQFSVVNRRNRTGHWVTQVNVDRDNDKKHNELWEFELDHGISKCGDKETLSVNASITPSPKVIITSPAKGYQLVTGHGYYKIYLQTSTWVEALQTCIRDGAHLLILDSDEEVKSLVPILRKHPKDLGDWRDHYFYIGIHDMYREGVYYTIHGDLIAYNKWSGEPTNSDERCGMVSTEGLLGDCLCEAGLYFVCEHNSNHST